MANPSNIMVLGSGTVIMPSSASTSDIGRKIIPVVISAIRFMNFVHKIVEKKTPTVIDQWAFFVFPLPDMLFFLRISLSFSPHQSKPQKTKAEEKHGGGFGDRGDRCKIILIICSFTTSRAMCVIPTVGKIVIDNNSCIVDG